MFLNLRMPDGTPYRLEALEGWRVMEVIRDWGLPIKAECAGACACATCHVWVGEDWVAKLTPPSSEELEMLDGAFNVDGRSRLCCQIIMSKALDGLEIELAPESLADAPVGRHARKPLMSRGFCSYGLRRTSPAPECGIDASRMAGLASRRRAPSEAALFSTRLEVA